MIRIRTIAALLTVSALGATAALAQEAPQTPAPTTPPAAATPPAATSTAPTPTTYSDTDVDQFASAALAVQGIEKDASVADADKQAKMASAVTSSGLSAEKFNAIATSSQSDPALMKRIQLAAAAKMTAPAAPASAAPAAPATPDNSTAAPDAASNATDTAPDGANQ